MGVNCFDIPIQNAGRIPLKKALWVRGVTAPAFSSTDQLSVNFVPSTTDWAFAVNPPNTKANRIIDFLIIISLKYYVLPAKSLDMLGLAMSNFLVHN